MGWARSHQPLASAVKWLLANVPSEVAVLEAHHPENTHSETCVEQSVSRSPVGTSGFPLCTEGEREPDFAQGRHGQNRWRARLSAAALALHTCVLPPFQAEETRQQPARAHLPSLQQPFGKLRLCQGQPRTSRGSVPWVP